MENKEQKVWMIVTIATITVLVFIFAGITYAFFTTSDNVGSTAEIISNSGKMTITYGDGTNTLVVAEDISPSTNIIADKTFSLTGTNTTCGLDMPFTIFLEYQNTFKNLELWYFLKRVDNSENVVVDIVDGTGTNDPLTQENLEQSDFDFPQDIVGYYACFINDWSDNLYSQKIASGYFKSNSEDETATFNLKMVFPEVNENQDYNKGATFNGKIVIKDPIPVNEITDSWVEIAANVRSGKTLNYNIGDTKEVEIGGTNYTVRVANNSTPSECSSTDFSQTACGLVFEFVDIIEERKLNSSETNVGGWPASELRTYANGEFFYKLPSELRNIIIDTKVISGHGSDDIANFTSTDKIYLLSYKEVAYDVLPENDTAYDYTRQLDYYKTERYNTGNFLWYIRTALSSSNDLFSVVSFNNRYIYASAANDSNTAFLPAFRIG